MQVLGFSDYAEQTAQLAKQLGCEHGIVDVHQFPDGEHRLLCPSLNTSHVVICRSLDSPNNKLIDLLLLANHLRENRVNRISLVAPYMCYMRQDIAFHEGEVVSQHGMGKVLADYFDDVITVDAHLHRVADIHQAIPAKHSVNLFASSAIRMFIEQLPDKPIILGPDAESRQWVQKIAGDTYTYGVANKQRFGDKDVRVMLPEIKFEQQSVLLVDDVVSSGYTMAKAAEALIQAGARQIDCIVTHALFAEGAEQLMQQSGISQIWSTDSVTHHTNTISLAVLLAGAMREL